MIKNTIDGILTEMLSIISGEKGINSNQLIYLKNRWWIANMIWTFETKESKILEKYLGKKQ